LSDNPRAREHIHPVFLNGAHYIGIGKLIGALEIGKSAAVLPAINEGLFRLGALDEQDYKLLDARYRVKLIDRIAERTAKSEPSHVPVLVIEKQKAAHKHLDYKAIPDEDVQPRYLAAVESGDTVEAMMLEAEANKRGLVLKGGDAI
jgi:hypothetical protein